MPQIKYDNLSRKRQPDTSCWLHFHYTVNHLPKACLIQIKTFKNQNKKIKIKLKGNYQNLKEDDWKGESKQNSSRASFLLPMAITSSTPLFRSMFWPYPFKELDCFSILIEILTTDVGL
ncbi:hypothetical protein V6Z12_D01G169300 [Gossypium hirsutum]